MARQRQTKADRALDAMIERTYEAHCAGTSINILNISKVFKAGRDAWLRAGTADAVTEAVKGAIAVYNESGAR